MNLPLPSSRGLRGLRWASWAVVSGCLVAVLLSYGRLPDELPLSRWTSAPKSWLLAVRVPLINLLSLGLVDVLSASIARIPRFVEGRRLRLLLLAVVSGKALLETAELMLLPARPLLLPLALGAVVATGLVSAIVLARPLWNDGRWMELVATRSEVAWCVVLLVGIFTLNLPLGIG